MVSLEFDVTGAGGCRHTGLDTYVVAEGCRGEVAAAQVPHRSLAQRDDTAEADAHPATDGISTPASSPTSSRGVAPSAVTVVPESEKVTSPPSPGTMTLGRNLSV